MSAEDFKTIIDLLSSKNAAAPRRTTRSSAFSEMRRIRKLRYVLETLTPAEVAGRYADRIYALERVEEPPKVMSMVLLTFGLEPRAPIEQR
jgi:hypothetical protein